MKTLLASLLFSLSALASNELTIYVFKSSVGVDWESPKKLAISVVKNELYKYFNGNDRLLGHVAIELKCGERRVMTGMRAARGENRRMVLKEGSGYGVLFHIFPGALEKEEQLKTEIAQKEKSGEVHSLHYTLNSQQCDLMWQHYENHLKNKGEFNYGFPLNTLAGEGGGCSAFGVSFLQAAKIDNPLHLKAWSGHVWVPTELIGPHNTQRYLADQEEAFKPNAGGKPLSVLDVILSEHSKSWAPENKGRYLEFFDPDTMFRWVAEKAKKPDPQMLVQPRESSIQLQFDMSQL